MEDFKVRIVKTEPSGYAVVSLDDDGAYLYSESLHDCVDWCLMNDAEIVIEI